MTILSTLQRILSCAAITALCCNNVTVIIQEINNSVKYHKNMIETECSLLPAKLLMCLKDKSTGAPYIFTPVIDSLTCGRTVTSWLDPVSIKHQKCN